MIEEIHQDISISIHHIVATRLFKVSEKRNTMCLLPRKINEYFDLSNTYRLTVISPLTLPALEEEPECVCACVIIYVNRRVLSEGLPWTWGLGRSSL